MWQVQEATDNGRPAGWQVLRDGYFVRRFDTFEAAVAFADSP